MREKSGVGSDVGGVGNLRDSFSVAMQKMIIRMYPQLTLKASPLNSRGSVRPTDRVRVVTSTLKGYGFLLGQANKFERASVARALQLCWLATERLRVGA